MRIEDLGRILRIEFDQLHVGNSFGIAQAEQLDATLAQHNQGKALLVTHQGRWFCAGGNLKDYSKFSQTQPSESLKINVRIAEVLTRLHQWPGFTVAVVRGDCFGGGVEVLSCFDLVLSVPHAFYGLWQRRIGLTYGWGGGARLAERLSRSELKLQSLLANSLCAYSAQRVGLVDEIWPGARIEERAYAVIAQQEGWSDFPVAAIKSSTGQQEQEIFSRLWGNADHLRTLKRWK